MKTVSAGFKAMLTSSKNLMVADLYTLTLLSGTVLYYTDAPQNIVFGGNTYAAARTGGSASTNVTASAASLGTGDGTTATFALRDNSLNPIIANAVVTAMHRSDWRGRIALSPSARTNLLPYSTDFSHWTPTNATLSTGNTSPDGLGTMTRITATATATNAQLAQTGTVTNGATYVLSCYARRDQNRYLKLFGFGNGSGGAVADLQTGAAQVNGTWLSISVQLIDAVTARISAVVQPISTGLADIGLASSMVGTATVAAGAFLDVWGAQLEAGSTATALIATTTAAKTVTDYTAATTSVTLGEAPATGAGVDWDGTGDIAVTTGGTAPGFGRGPIKLAIGLQVESLEVDIFYDADTRIMGKTPGAFANAGGFDGARLKVDKFLTASLSDTTNGIVNLFTGTVADISAGSGKVALNVSSDLVYLNAAFPRNYFLPQCNNALFDAGCTLAKATLAVAGATTSSTKTTITASALTQASGYFALGYIVITSGANAGLTRTVKSFAAGVLTLLYPLTGACAAGDTFTAYPGCDKLQATCSVKFANLPHFRGFPYVPTPEVIELGQNGNAPADNSGGGAGIGSGGGGGIGRGPGGQNGTFKQQ